MSKQESHLYEFGPYRLLPQERQLLRDGEPVPLTPKAFETLVALVRRAGRLADKDELLKEVWPDSFVEESNLTQNVFALRRALGKGESGKPYIETVPKRGYRFLASVKVFEARGDEVVVRQHVRASSSQSGQEVRTGANGDHVSADTAVALTVPPADADAASAAALSLNVARITRPQISTRGGLFLGSVALVVVILAGFALRFGWNEESLKAREIKLRRLTESGKVRGAALSPDGISLAYVMMEGKKTSLRLKNIVTESEVVIVPPSEAGPVSPRFSPDGNFIYYGHREGIFQIPVFGGEPRKIASNNWSEFSVSPDGRQVAFPRGSSPGESSSIIVAETDGSSERVVATRRDPEYYVGWGPAPVWSPDGEHLTVVTGRHGEGVMRLVEVSLQTGVEREIKTQDVWQVIEYLGWTSASELMMTAQKKGEGNIQIWSVKFPGGEAARVTNDFNDYLNFSLIKNADKFVVLQESVNLHLWVFDKETGSARQITSGINNVDGRFGLAFAPDGRIIYTARDKNNYDIFSINLDGGEMRQLTKNAGRRNVEAVVSPDNRFIAFVSDRTGAPRLWLMNLDGTEARQLTPPSDNKENEELNPYFSPDGKWIYYTFSQIGKGSIWKISIDSGKSVAVSRTSKSVWGPAVSPDGRFLAHAVYNDEAKSPWQVAVMTLEDPSGKERFFNFPAFRQRVRWTSDSQSLVAIDDSFDGGNLWSNNVTTDERKQITNFSADNPFHFDISRDERYYVVSRGNGFRDVVLIER